MFNLNLTHNRESTMSGTDKDPLMAAAKAAGVLIFAYRDDMYTAPFENHSMSRPWNPLKDDGDALRLAVRLNFTVKIDTHEVEVFDNASGECLASIPIFEASTFVSAEHATDPGLATRLAITRAAAALAHGGEGKS